MTKDSYPLEQSEYKDIRNIPVEDIFKSLVDNRSNIFYPWTSISSVSELQLLYILLDNKIKCNILQYEGIDNKIDILDQCSSQEEKDSAMCDNNIWLKENAEKIAKKYTNCAKNKEPLFRDRGAFADALHSYVCEDKKGMARKLYFIESL